MPAKLKPISSDGVRIGYMMRCPGCGSYHAIYTERPNDRGAKWSFDGNLEAPTFHPSILARWTWGEAHEPKVCHFFVRTGKIEFCGDSTHELAGKTVELPEMDW
jgi:hypothetical protein